jgi:hypothetical protein
MAAPAPSAKAKAEIEFPRAVKALAKAAGMFELTGGGSEEAWVPAVEDGYGVGLEVEEGPI